MSNELTLYDSESQACILFGISLQIEYSSAWNKWHPKHSVYLWAFHHYQCHMIKFARNTTSNTRILGNNYNIRSPLNAFFLKKSAKYTLLAVSHNIKCWFITLV